MNKMPVIWCDFIKFQRCTKKITFVRRMCNEAQRSQPITQHQDWIWPEFLKFSNECDVPETKQKIWKRYISINQNGREEYIDVQKGIKKYDEAAKQLYMLQNDINYISKKNYTKYDIWIQLLEQILQHPSDVQRVLDIDRFQRTSSKRYPEQNARIWYTLASYYTIQGQQEPARDIYEEALLKIVTVKDFTKIFERYSEFLDTVVAAQMERIEELQKIIAVRQKNMSDDNNGIKNVSKRMRQGEIDTTTNEIKNIELNDKNNKINIIDNKQEIQPLKSLQRLQGETNIDLSLWMQRYEKQQHNREQQMNSVQLRGNPNNVTGWQNRIEIQKKDKQLNEDKKKLEILKTYMEAVESIDVDKAIGKQHIQWENFALYYEKEKQLQDCRSIFEKAVKISYRSQDNYVHVWCTYSEMELQTQNKTDTEKERAIYVIKQLHNTLRPYRGVTAANNDTTEISASVTAPAYLSQIEKNIYKSPVQWGQYVDLSECYGSFEETKNIYERMISQKVITPSLVLYYIEFLENNKYIEEIFRVFEKCIKIFTYPHTYILWIQYIYKFIKYYGGNKQERTRDIFEQSQKQIEADTNDTVVLMKMYILYSQYEEKYGVPRKMQSILDRAFHAVQIDIKIQIFWYYIYKVTEYFGAIKTRDIFDKAMKIQPEKYIPDIGVKYAALERKQQEYERAREIYKYTAQFCNPLQHEKFWSIYKKFELLYGNDDTFRDMLASRRSVKSHYTQHTLSVIDYKPDDTTIIKSETVQFDTEKQLQGGME